MNFTPKKKVVKNSGPGISSLNETRSNENKTDSANKKDDSIDKKEVNKPLRSNNPAHSMGASISNSGPESSSQDPEKTLWKKKTTTSSANDIAEANSGSNSIRPDESSLGGTMDDPVNRMNNRRANLPKKPFITNAGEDNDGLKEEDQIELPDAPPNQKIGPVVTAVSDTNDGFNDEGDDMLTRIQRRINALRKNDRQGRILITIDDLDLETVDTNLIASLNMIKRRRKGLKLNDAEEQKNIAISLAIKAKWPQYVAAGLTVAFVVADIALIVLGVTQEFNLVDIPSLELIQGIVEFAGKVFETAEEAAEARRNGRGESEEVMKMRRTAGQAAIMELTGVNKLNDQQKEVYNRLRAVLTLQQKESNAKADKEKKAPK